MYEQEKEKDTTDINQFYIKDIVFRVTLFHPFCVCVYILFIYILSKKKKQVCVKLLFFDFNNNFQKNNNNKFKKKS